MAARSVRLEQNDKIREKICAGLLINHLRNHVLGRKEMSPTQLRAAEILLRKVVPDLTSVDHTGDITHHYVAEVPAVAADPNEWQKQNSATIN